MISRIYEALPGGPVVRRVVMSLLFGLLAILLVLFYDWLGTTLLDSGGPVG